jgi:hypothetical protein
LDELLHVTEYFVNKEERAVFVASASKLLNPAKTGPQKGQVVVKNESNAYELILFMLGVYKNLSIAKDNRAKMLEKGVLPCMTRLLTAFTHAEAEL